MPEHIVREGNVGAPEEEGIVVKTTDNIARVKIIRGAGCSTCAIAKNCPFQTTSQKDWQVWARNEHSAKVGDKVKLAISPTRYLLIAALVFIFPVSVLLIAYFVSKLLGANEQLAVMLSVGCAFLTYFILRTIDKSSMKETSYTIVKIIDQEKSVNQGEIDVELPT